jgi:hypothetical protein
MQTLYEHMQTTDFKPPMEDDEFRYITIPPEDERAIKFFRLGYEPAADHPSNDAGAVVLRIRKDRHMERYQEDCNFLKGLVNDAAAEAGKSNAAVFQTSAQGGRPRTMNELVEGLPEIDPEGATPDEQ